MVLESVTAVVLIFLGWGAILATTSGVGWFVLRAMDADAYGRDRWFRAVWLGLAATALLAEAWHLFRPMDAGFAGVLVLVALGGYRISGTAARLALRDALGQAGPITIAALVAVTLWYANRASGPPRHLDALTYHLNAVRWYAEYPIVRGLANLQDRLAFNNVSHLFHAILENAGFAGRSFHLVNSFIVALVSWRAILGASRLLTDTSETRLLDMYWLLLLTPAVSVAASSSMSSPTTDWPATAAALAAIAELIDLTLGRESDPRARLASLWGAVALFTLSAAIKLGYLPLAALGSAAALLIWGAGADRRLRLRTPAVWSLVLFCAALMGLWMYRNVLMTGYLVFPMLGRVELPWTTPDLHRRLTEQNVFVDARFSRHVANVYASPWIGNWLRWQLGSINFGYTVLPGLIAVAGLIAAGASWRRLRSGREWPAVAVVWMCAVPALAAWWITAPMPRMGAFLFWSLAGATAALGWTTWLERSRWLTRLGAAAAIALAGTPVVGWFLLTKVLHKTQGESANLLYASPGPDRGLTPAPAAELEPFRTRSGLVLMIPAVGLGCADAALPCTPFPNRELCLINPTRIAAGFRIDPGLARPATREEEQQIWRYISANAKPSDLLYVNADASTATRKALELGHLPSELTLIPQSGEGSDFQQMLADFESLLGRGRVWFVFADGPLGPEVDELAASMDALDTIAVRGPHLHTPGISACLYEMLPPR